MFESKRYHLIFSIILMLVVIFVVSDMAMRWNYMMETNRMRLFINIILSVIFTSKSIDHVIQWRNHGKPKAEEE